MKPPVTYFGGKTMLAERIVAELPPHEHYVEPYCGSLAVLLAKSRSTMETVNDLDGDLMTFWRVLRSRTEEFVWACAMTPHARAEHEAAYENTDDDLERARRVWVQLTQGRAGTRRSTGWRHYADPCGSKTSMPDYLVGYLVRMMPTVERIAGVSLECRPALEVIEAYGASENVLLYVDPPYLGSTRVSGGYMHEMRDETSHRELAEALRGCKASVVLSGYASPLYQDLYDGWHLSRFNTMTGQGGTRQGRTEVLWSNRPPQDCLFGMGGAAA